MSISLATLDIVSPVWRNVTEQQASTTCKPRKHDPSASARVFPCSLVISSATLLWTNERKTRSMERVKVKINHTIFFLIKSWKRNMICCRWSIVVFDHVRNVSLQLSTASFISAVVDFGTRPMTSLVDWKWNQCKLCMIQP